MNAHEEVLQMFDQRVREMLELWSTELEKASTVGQFLQTLTELNLEWHIVVGSEDTGAVVDLTPVIAELANRERHG